MDVPAVGIGGLAGNQVFEARSEFVTMIEDGMGDGSGVNGEEHAVDEYVTSREVSRRVGLVTGLVEHRLVVDDL